MSYTINTFGPDSMKMLKAITNVLNTMENPRAKTYWAKLISSIASTYKDIGNQEFADKRTVHTVIDSVTNHFIIKIEVQLFTRIEYQIRSEKSNTFVLETHTKNYLEVGIPFYLRVTTKSKWLQIQYGKIRYWFFTRNKKRTPKFLNIIRFESNDNPN